MKLYEFEGKQIFSQAGIPVPSGAAVRTPEAAVETARKIGFPVVVKSQVLRGGRGKAGGIKFVADERELVRAFADLQSLKLSGELVEIILIEEKLDVAREFYLGITLDPRESLPLLMVSAQGGMDIEQVARDYPQRLFKTHLDPLAAYRLHQALDLLLKTGLQGRQLVQAAKILHNLVRCYFEHNALTAEINPLVIDASGNVMAADSKIEIDDSALFKIKAVQGFERKTDISDPLEAEAKSLGISYVGMDKGNIGLIAGGAGLGMASMDMIWAHGGAPANFLDLGGDATMEKTANALRVVLKTSGVKGVFINLFGGINNCEQMARGVVRVINELQPTQAIVVKMRGHSQDEGWAILESENIPIIKFGTTEEAVILLLEQMNKKRVTDHGYIS